MQIKRSGNKKNNPLKMWLIIFVLAGCFSLLLAFIWQKTEEGQKIEGQSSAQEAMSSQLDLNQAVTSWEDESSLSSQLTASLEEETQSQQESDLESALLQESSLPQSQEDASQPSDINYNSMPGSVPFSQRVDNAYFKDAIFFGDSISTGIPLYQVAGNPDTIAYTGINPLSINTAEVIKTPNGMTTFLEAAKLQYPDKTKVYIMLGANGLWLEKKTFIDGYKTFLLSVKAQYPKAKIYVQSILPVTTKAYEVYPTANNDIISEYNTAIAQLAIANNVNYLDVSSALVDENGALPLEASPLDGMHLTPEYYNKWFEYLKTHVVEG